MVNAVEQRAGERCYHCGLPVPEGSDVLAVVIGGAPRAMCCVGCQAVAQAIVSNGLGDYYTHRDALPDSPREAVPAALRELGVFDHPEVQRGFVRPIGDHEREASLILEGITCAACVWLNETHLARQPGVAAVEVNYATRRARVRWDDRATRLSAILTAIEAIGYRAYPYDPDRSEQLAVQERRGALLRLAVAGLGMMQVMMYAVPAYIAEEGTMSADVEGLLRWASLVLTLPVVLYSAAPFFRGSLRDFRLRRVGMDVPVALGVASAFAASVWATIQGRGDVYFDSVSMFLFLLLSGRYIEIVARQKAVRGVERIAKAIPLLSERLTDYPSRTVEQLPAVSLGRGDVVQVRPGHAFPADGVVIEGESRADESLVTGEARPVAKRPGDAVVGGSLNGESLLIVRVEQVGEGTRLAAIQRLMERAAAERPRAAEMADRISAHFVAAILAVAAASGIAWMQIDPARALPVFVAVLVVSCPCALSLATPAALAAATGAMSRLGLLVTRGHAIETLARASHVVFDKTGTLTTGRLALVRAEPIGNSSADEALAVADALERGSEHAIGTSLAKAADSCSRRYDASAVRITPGAGVEGTVNGARYRIGRVDFVRDLHGRAPTASIRQALEEGVSVAVLGSESDWVAVFRFEDELRPNAMRLVAELVAERRHVTILSGDTPAAVDRVAAEIGIATAQGGLTPEQKHERVQQLQASGAVVAMVGDGVNDAPVLAQAHVSIAMGCGTDLARAQGDIVLLADELDHLRRGFAIAARALRVIRQNLAWAILYNVVALPLAVTGLLTPWLAGLGMSLSSALVVLNAVRLTKDHPGPARDAATR